MIYLIIIAGIIGGEYAVKQYMEKHLRKDKEILKGNVILNLYHNKGIALNLLEKNFKLIKIITGTLIGIMLMILSYCIGAKKSALRNLGLSLLLGGAISNYIDRMQKGYVVDYFSFKGPKKIRGIVFNLADFAIFIGGVLIIVAEAFTGGDK